MKASGTGQGGIWHLAIAGYNCSPRCINRAVRAARRGVRVILCFLPVKSPWLNPIEAKWVHGKRAVVEPARVLSMAELMQRVCAYYQCELTDPIAQPDC